MVSRTRYSALSPAQKYLKVKAILILSLLVVNATAYAQVAEYKSYEMHMSRENGQKTPSDLWHKFETLLSFDYPKNKFAINDGKEHAFFLRRTVSANIDSVGTDHIVYAAEDSADGDSCVIDLILYADPGNVRFNIGYIMVSWDQRQFYVAYKLKRKD
jgi:hypothetical protein